MSSSSDDGSSPDRSRSARDDRPETVRGWLNWFWTVDHGPAMMVREFLVSVGMVALVGALLFAISGVWPPMVAIESGSMEPHMFPNDLVFIMDDSRFVPEAAVQGTGVVTYQAGQETGYRTFGEYGDVIIYKPNGDSGQVPIIHRARFWVEEGENWYDEANPEYVGTADDCEELRYCPAPNSGFITKGDNQVTNQRYDQARGLSRPVKPEWMIGTAEFRVPWLGWIRLQLAQLAGTPAAVDPSIEGDPTPTSVEPRPGTPEAGPRARLG